MNGSHTGYLTPEERRQRHREQMKEDILEIARRLMRAHGVAALSLNEIARQLGMTTPALYVYFEGKTALYDALFCQGAHSFARWMEEKGGQDGPIGERLRRATEAYMGFAIENPELYQLLFERPVPGFVPSEESLAVSLAALQAAQENLARVIQAGELAPDLPLGEATDLAIAVIHGLTALHMANEPHLPAGEGRFGHLIPYAVALLKQAWRPEDRNR